MRTEDGYLISKCLSGERETFGLLVDKYRSSIYAFAYAKLDWEKHVRIDKRYFRPTETEVLVADPAKAKRELKLSERYRKKTLLRRTYASEIGTSLVSFPM